MISPPIVIPPRITPTPEELRNEITTGPYKDQLAPFWAAVFEYPDADPPKPDDPELVGKWEATCASNEVKRNRAGTLEPDSAFEINAILTKSGRLEELYWTISSSLVIAAHNEMLGR